jgi:uncharacterized membrane protein YbhN (UPF0104 family)
LIEKWNELNAALLILVVFALVESMLESSVIIIIGVGLGILIFGIMRNHLVFSLFRKIILRFPRLKVLEESVETSRDALKHLSSRTEGFIFTVPAMILQDVPVFFVLHALGIKISFVTSTQIFYVALISGVLSFIPGGLVVTEASMLGLLIKYYDHDVSHIHYNYSVCYSMVSNAFEHTYQSIHYKIQAAQYLTIIADNLMLGKIGYE